MILDRWVNNQGVTIHYLDCAGKTSASRLPLLYLPGLMSSAENFQDEMRRLRPRRSLAVSFRGQGKSDQPLTGYDLNAYVSDVEAVVTAAGLERFILMAYSRAVPVALEWAARHSHRVAGLLLLDYGPRNKRIPKDWVERVITQFPEAPKAVVEAIQREAADVDLTQRLSLIQCPVWVLYGENEGSLLLKADKEAYQKGLAQSEWVPFEHSGHELWVPDYERFMQTVESILERIDRNANRNGGNTACNPTV